MPFLRDYLCDTVFADGTARQTSTLLVFTEDGCWKGCLTDRELQRVGWAAGRSLGDLLRTLDRLLTEDRLEWRRKAPQGPRKGR